MNKIRKDDEIIVISGKSKGMRGKVKRVLKGQRVVVEGVNMIKKHVRANPRAEQQGGIIEREAAIHLSNVALYNPTSKKADKVGIRILEDGTKARYFKSNQELVDI